MLTGPAIAKQSELREKLVDRKSKRILIARIEGSIEGDDDYTRVNCQGYGRIRSYSSFSLHFGRTPTLRRPLRLHATEGGAYETQVFQLAGCDFRCWYCFVDDALLRADEKRARWFSAEELLDLALDEKEAPAVIDLSGGQPELVPEFIIWMMEAVEKKGLRSQLSVWSDDNLSCDFLWTCLDSDQRRYIKEFPGYTRTVCLKGFDAHGFVANTGAPGFFFERQLQNLQRLIEEGFHTEVYLTMLDIERPMEEAMATIDRMLRLLSSIQVNLPYRVIPLKIHPFGNMFKRANRHRLSTLALQVDRFQLWQDRLAQFRG